MIKPGRIACINPRCNRTAAQEKHPDCDEIVCYKCWKLLPKELTDRYRSLRKRYKYLDRQWAKKIAINGQLVHARNRALNLLIDQVDENWTKISGYFRETEKPEGIETFLKEIGL